MTAFEDIVDAGRATLYGPMGPVRVGFCGRQECDRLAAEPGLDFCEPCLAWLRGDSGEDPLAPPPQEKLTPGELATLRGYGSGS